MPINSQISIKYDNLVGENTYPDMTNNPGIYLFYAVVIKVYPYPDMTNNPGIYPGYLKCGV